MNEVNYFAGTSGLVSPPKRTFPPDFQQKSRLHYYSSLFNSIEINSSFYKCPQAATMRKWWAEVGDDFRFTFKLFRDITHAKGLQYDSGVLTNFIDVIDAVGDKKACLLVQFPPSLGAEHRASLERLLDDLANAKRSGWSLAVEFRNKSWYNDHIFRLLDSYGAGMVIQDIPKSATPIIEQDASFIYLRFHGPDGNYRGSYTDDFLYEYSYYIKDWISEGKTIYAYFNNTMGDAYNNLITLKRYVEEQLDG